MLPGFTFYLSRYLIPSTPKKGQTLNFSEPNSWYRRSELVFRLAVFLLASPLAGAFSGLLASAILSLSNGKYLKSLSFLIT